MTCKVNYQKTSAAACKEGRIAEVYKWSSKKLQQDFYVPMTDEGRESTRNYHFTNFYGNYSKLHQLMFFFNILKGNGDFQQQHKRF